MHIPEPMVGGRYLLGPEIGRGGYGAVYQATDQKSGRAVALKVLNAVIPAQHDRFRREVAALRALRHPHIVEVLDVGSGDAPGNLYLAMELLRGETLSALYKEVAIPPARAARLIDQLLSALERAHGLGIVHRDLKPANLFIVDAGTSRETLKVLDFGLARAVDAPSLTKTGEILGTPAYMAPEQARGGRVDERTDIYAVGACLYAVLAGRAPRDGAPIQQVVRAMSGETTPLLEIAPAVPVRLAEVVERAMRADPAQRFESAAAMRAALAKSLAPHGGPDSEDAYNGGSRGNGGDGRRRALIAVAALSLAVTAGGAGYLAFGSSPARLPRPVAPPGSAADSTPQPSATASDLAPLLPVPSVTLARSLPNPPAPSPGGTFKPCARDDQCGPMEKCYPGGCSCRDSAVRCGAVCRLPGQRRNDCGCSTVCKDDEQCQVHNSMTSCVPCRAGTRICGGEVCVDLQSTASDCGACGHVCARGQRCAEGKCVNPGRAGERCVAFGQCASNLDCLSGVCQCREGTTLCRGDCVLGTCK